MRYLCRGVPRAATPSHAPGNSRAATRESPWGGSARRGTSILLSTRFWPVCNIVLLFVPNSEQDRPLGPGSIIRDMARGWESKSVEAQQADAAERSAPAKPRLTAEQAGQLRAKEGLLLSCRRIQHELQATRNQGYREMLEMALAELNDRLSKLT